jgi:hypothetical protein
VRVNFSKLTILHLMLVGGYGPQLRPHPAAHSLNGQK